MLLELWSHRKYVEPGDQYFPCLVRANQVPGNFIANMYLLVTQQYQLITSLHFVGEAFPTSTWLTRLYVR